MSALRWIGMSAILLAACAEATNEPDPDIAKYERWVKELRAKDAQSRSLLEASFAVPVLSTENYAMKDVIELELTGEEASLQIGYALQIAHGAEDPAKDGYSEIINVVEDGPNITILFSRDGIKEGPLYAEQHVVEAQLSAANTALVTGYGVRYLCRITHSQPKWGKEPCA